jgi:hypothetical protein
MSARLVKRWTHAGKIFITGPRLNLVATPGEAMPASHCRPGGRLLSAVVCHRLGAYKGDGV